MPTLAQANRLRSDLASLVRVAHGDLRVLFREFTNADAARAALMDVLPQMVALYGAAAATLAADWYDDVRDADGARDRFSAIPADVSGDAGTDELARWGIGPLFQKNPDWAAAQSLVEGGIQRRIANASRNTIIGSSLADPSTVGWKRIGAGACAFCRMLIGRDVLYTEATADFASHDHCNCQAYPLIEGAEPIDVKEYVKSERNITDADRARVREYLRTH